MIIRILIILLLIALFFVLVMIIDNHRIVVRTYEVSSRKLLRGYHFVFIADIHEKCLGNENETIVNKIAGENPMFILVGGDLVISKKVWQAQQKAQENEKSPSNGKDYNPSADQEVPVWMKHSYLFMKRLCEIAPVFFIDGNHEIRMHEEYLFGNSPKENGSEHQYGSSYKVFREALEQLGVCFLDDTRMETGLPAAHIPQAGGKTQEEVSEYVPSFHWHGRAVDLTEDLELQGLNLPMYYYRKFQKTEMPEGEVEKLLSRKPDPSRFTVLLTHSPVYFDRYAQWGADLTLCGHVHGGLMRLPLIGGVVGTRPNLFPKYSGGEYTYPYHEKKENEPESDRKGRNESKLIVTCGLGVHTLPIRIFNPGEISVIDLEPERIKD